MHYLARGCTELLNLHARACAARRHKNDMLRLSIGTFLKGKFHKFQSFQNHHLGSIFILKIERSNGKAFQRLMLKNLYYPNDRSHYLLWDELRMT